MLSYCSSWPGDSSWIDIAHDENNFLLPLGSWVWHSFCFVTINKYLLSSSCTPNTVKKYIVFIGLLAIQGSHRLASAYLSNFITAEPALMNTALARVVYWLTFLIPNSVLLLKSISSFTPAPPSHKYWMILLLFSGYTVPSLGGNFLEFCSKICLLPVPVKYSSLISDFSGT